MSSTGDTVLSSTDDAVLSSTDDAVLSSTDDAVSLITSETCCIKSELTSFTDLSNDSVIASSKLQPLIRTELEIKTTFE